MGSTTETPALVDQKKKKFKYRLYEISIWFLIIGASLSIGLLSFGGLYALWPMLPVAILAFVLATAYEGQVYKENLIHVFDKLMNPELLLIPLAKQFLNERIQTLGLFDSPTSEWPEFILDYKKQVDIVALNHHDLDAAEVLSDMEAWFTHELLTNQGTTGDPYIDGLMEWIKQNSDESALLAWRARAKRYQYYYSNARYLSLAIGLIMALGSTYLLVDTFSVIPLFTMLSPGLWPTLIIPLALITGSAYGLLTYNAMVDMINNDSLLAWLKKIKAYIDEGLTLRTIGIISIALICFSLAILLTLSTAGTWWTVARETAPLFHAMRHMPQWIMGVITPTFMFIAAFFFNMENVSETMDMMEESDETAKRNLYLISRNDADNANTEAFQKGQKQPYTHCYIKDGDRLYYVNHHGKIRPASLKEGSPADLFTKRAWKNRSSSNNSSILLEENPIRQSTLSKKDRSFIQISESFFTRRYDEISALWNRIKYNWKNSRETENLAQTFNPFRAALRLGSALFMGLRLSAFLGHITSIGATGDKQPWIPIPAAVSMGLGGGSEAAEDLHYFIPKDKNNDACSCCDMREEEHPQFIIYLKEENGALEQCCTGAEPCLTHRRTQPESAPSAIGGSEETSAGTSRPALPNRAVTTHINDEGKARLINHLLNSDHHGHNHGDEDDLPTQFLKVITYPIYLSALLPTVLWDYTASQWNDLSLNPNRQPLTWQGAIDLYFTERDKQFFKTMWAPFSYVYRLGARWTPPADSDEGQSLLSTDINDAPPPADDTALHAENTDKSPSLSWQRHHWNFLIDQETKRLGEGWGTRSLRERRQQTLSTLKIDARTNEPQRKLEEVLGSGECNKHRFFSFSTFGVKEKNTDTVIFLTDRLSRRKLKIAQSSNDDLVPGVNPKSDSKKDIIQRSTPLVSEVHLNFASKKKKSLIVKTTCQHEQCTTGCL